MYASPENVFGDLELDRGLNLVEKKIKKNKSTVKCQCSYKKTDAY